LEKIGNRSQHRQQSFTQLGRSWRMKSSGGGGKCGGVTTTWASASRDEEETEVPFAPEARTGSAAVAAGAAMRSTAGRQSAAGTRRRSKATTSSASSTLGSASPGEEKEVPFGLDRPGPAEAVAGRNSASYIRLAYRYYSSPSDRYYYLGFRIAR